MKRPAVFLDRDNTLIHNDGDLGDPDAVRLMQGVAPAIASICGLGFKVVVVTNQGGVARGKYRESDVDAVHARIEQLVADRVNGARIDRFYFCPYHPNGSVERYTKEHPHRKPQPGMLLQAAEDLKLDLSQSWMIGDALRDVEAGAAAGCRTILLQHEATTTAPLATDDDNQKTGGKGEPDFVAQGLVEAVRIIASQPRPELRDDKSRPRPAPRRREADGNVAGQPSDTRPGRNPAGTSPADDAAALPAPKPAHPPRPFVPWTKQRPPAPPTPPTPPPPSPPSSAAPASTAEASASSSEAPTKAPTTSVSPSPPASESSASASGNTTPPPAVENSATNDPPPAASPEIRPQPPAPPPPPPPTAAAKSVDPDVASADADDVYDQELARLNKTARLVLQELRAQRGSTGEVQQLGVAAIAIQAVAFLCMLGALWMGGGDGGDAAFFRWIGVALMLQLAVIATLLFSRPSH